MSSKTRLPPKHREVPDDPYARTRNRCIQRLSERRQEQIERRRHGDVDKTLDGDVSRVIEDALSSEMKDFGGKLSREQVSALHLELMIMFEQEIEEQNQIQESQELLEDSERFEEEYLQYMINLQRP